MERKHNPLKVGHQGFSLIELIVIIVIMAVLSGVLVPQLIKYVNTNRAKACQIDREAILAVYERCVYEKSQELKTENLDKILKYENPATNEEVSRYNKCPSGGTYTAEVDKSTAIIHCSHDNHEDVLVNMVGWEGEEYAEGIDPELTQPTLPVVPDTEPPTTDAEDGSDEEEGTEQTIWPYAEDERWEGKRFPGQYIEIAVPTMFTSNEGNTYIFIDNGEGNGTFRVYWEWNLGPENIDTRGRAQCIPWSGVTIEDVESVRYREEQADGTLLDTESVTGVHYGDIIVYNGGKYVYASTKDALQQPLPGQDGSGFYPVE